MKKKKKLSCYNQLKRSQTRKTWVNNWSRSLTQVFQLNRIKEKFWIQLHPQLSRPHLPTQLSRSSIPLSSLKELNQPRTTPKFPARSVRQPLQLPKNPKQRSNHLRLLSDLPQPQVNLFKNVRFLPQIAILSLRTIWNHNHWQLLKNRLCKTEIVSISSLAKMPAIVCRINQEIYRVSRVNNRHRSITKSQRLLLSFYHLSLNHRKRL